jgi:hypothetical protein
MSSIRKDIHRDGTIGFAKKPDGYVEAQCPQKLLEMLYKNWLKSEGKANQD